jgi:hydrogenase maturation protein HypF
MQTSCCNVFLRITLRGRVQGIGFRPFVWRLARQLGLSGFVRNIGSAVVIDVRGDEVDLDRFVQLLQTDAPFLARIDSVETERLPPPVEDRTAFVIDTSQSRPDRARHVAPDLALCDDCLRDLGDHNDRRRYKYPLVNCTNCGPRFSIVRSVPYDRANTTMAPYELCPTCSAEYRDPFDRRFHAQPTACHRCGPRVEFKRLPTRENEVTAWLDSDPASLSEAAISAAASVLLRGEVIAIKGIGGFHLACRADCDDAVRRLRTSKRRPTKPLALMVRSLAEMESLVRLSDASRRAAASPAAPIVIAPMRLDARDRLSSLIAPGTNRLGVMLAYAPIHHLLFDRFPAGAAIVMTSGNDGDEPITYDDSSAAEELSPHATSLLTHDRAIARPIDDSIVLQIDDDDPASAPLPIRRARGYVPDPIALPATIADRAGAGLAVGAELKSTFCLVSGGEAVLSPHLGDLANLATNRHFERSVKDMSSLFDVAPVWIAHDFHPTYLSTTYAKRRASSDASIELVGVQHHHAHAAAVLAENGCSTPAVAIVCDGTGYGTDGTIWGCEVLVADLCDFQRVAHLHPLRLPGGDASARHPWRSALALLRKAIGIDFDRHPLLADLVRERSEPLAIEMVRNDVNCVTSSSAGRLFDAVAALLGICTDNTFEAEAPMALENAAEPFEGESTPWPVASLDDLRSLVSQMEQDVARGEPSGRIAMRFHLWLASALVREAETAASRAGVRDVALTGGVMCNRLLVRAITRMLRERGLNVLRHRLVPPNDGGVSFGQAVVACARRARQTGGVGCV